MVEEQRKDMDVGRADESFRISIEVIVERQGREKTCEVLGTGEVAKG